MSHNPYNDTFDEYIAFHKNVVKNAEQKSTKLSESAHKEMSDDEFMKSHNIIPLEIFIKNMNGQYGI